MIARLTSRLPLVSAPMAGVAGGQMAAEMIRAGGTGFIAANGTSTEHLRKEVDLAHRLLGHSSGRLPNLGIGILLWRLEQPGCSEAAETLIRLACEQASLLWLSFGVETERWVRLARQYAGSDIALCLIATSVESALEAARLGADYVVVQGNEAGGHGFSDSQPLFSLLPTIADSLRSNNLERPLLAAGGLVHPTQVAAALVLEGCVGAVLGTALLATSASTYAPAQKAAIVAAKRTGPRSMLFDKLRGQHDWPKGVDGRGLENASSREALTGLSDDEVKRRFDEAVARGEPDRLITWAGTSVAYVTDEKELGVVVQRIEAGLRKAPGDLSSLLSAAM